MVLWLNNNRLLQEQLKYKSKFNFVTFDSQAVAWRNKLAEINEDNLEQAASWIREIKVKWRLNWARQPERFHLGAEVTHRMEILRNVLRSKGSVIVTRHRVQLQPWLAHP